MVETSQHSSGMHSYYIPLALYLGVGTGMRREEIFDLTWNDVDLDSRHINIRKSKTGVPRLIVIPIITLLQLHQLFRQLAKAALAGNYAFNYTDYVLYPKVLGFDDKKKQRNAIRGFEQELAKVRKKAGLNAEDKSDRFTFRCLRREANAQFLKCLNALQANRMLGQINNRKDMTHRYWTLDDEDLRDIRDRLDKHALGGKTLGEHLAELNAMSDEDKATLDEGLWKAVKEITENIKVGLPSPITGMSKDYEIREQQLREQPEGTRVKAFVSRTTQKAMHQWEIDRAKFQEKENERKQVRRRFLLATINGR
jgi:hypothetical protein